MGKMPYHKSPSVRPPKLTPRRLEIYAFIKATLAEHGQAPTLQEIANQFSIRTPTGAQGHLAGLEKAGLIVREPFARRGIKLAASDPLEAGHRPG